jgi:hypothetical protein
MAPQIALTLLLVLQAFPGVAQAQSVEPSTTAPFTSSERWSAYLHRTFSPSRTGILAVETAFDQLQRQPHCWDNSAGSYAQRYARAFDRRLIKNTAELAAGLVTGEDLRYQRSHSRSVHGRVWHALQSSVTAQMGEGDLPTRGFSPMQLRKCPPPIGPGSRFEQPGGSSR